MSRGLSKRTLIWLQHGTAVCGWCGYVGPNFYVLRSGAPCSYCRPCQRAFSAKRQPEALRVPKDELPKLDLPVDRGQVLVPLKPRVRGRKPGVFGRAADREVK